MRQKIAIEALDDAALRSQVEIDQDVTTENNVQTRSETGGVIIRKIGLAEVHCVARSGSDLELELREVTPAARSISTNSSNFQ